MLLSIYLLQQIDFLEADRLLPTEPGHPGRGNSCSLWSADSKRLNDKDEREAAGPGRNRTVRCGAP